MNAQGKPMKSADRVDSLLRTPDSAPWSQAPDGLKDRVLASLADAPRAIGDAPRVRTLGWAMAACVAITAGGLGLLAGAAAWRNAPVAAVSTDLAATNLPPAGPGVERGGDAPTVLLARAFDDLKPAGSTRLMASVSAPIRNEAQGIAAETTLAARTVLSRLPFVSMD